MNSVIDEHLKSVLLSDNFFTSLVDDNTFKSLILGNKKTIESLVAKYPQFGYAVANNYRYNLQYKDLQYYYSLSSETWTRLFTNIPCLAWLNLNFFKDDRENKELIVNNKLEKIESEFQTMSNHIDLFAVINNDQLRDKIITSFKTRFAFSKQEIFSFFVKSKHYKDFGGCKYLCNLVLKGKIGVFPGISDCFEVANMTDELVIYLDQRKILK